MGKTYVTDDLTVTPIVQPDIMKSTPDCPVCDGQTEWTQLANGEYVAKCYFCGHIFRSQV